MNFESRPNAFTQKFDIYGTFKNHLNQPIAMKIEHNFATQAEADKRAKELQTERETGIREHQESMKQHG